MVLVKKKAVLAETFKYVAKRYIFIFSQKYPNNGKIAKKFLNFNADSLVSEPLLDNSENNP